MKNKPKKNNTAQDLQLTRRINLSKINDLMYVDSILGSL